MARSSSRVLALTTAVAALVAAAGCTPPDGRNPTTPIDAATAACTKESLRTRTPGILTIATDEPAREPWYRQNKPETGEGFEAAVAYAVAAQLGYASAEVTWTRVRFADATPAPASFDFAVNQFSVTEERKQAVDLSAPYYLVRQAVIARKSSTIAGKKSLAGLKDARLGAQLGTTSYQAITDIIKPGPKPQGYRGTDEATQALRSGQIDGLVVDLPAAFRITSTEMTDATVVGQVPQVGAPETFGLLLGKDSPLTPCVNEAISELREAKTLTELEQKWLAQAAGATELT
ncbi:amino acid ABC transporter substrate-binding protein [Micromonospora sp. KC606]|uniref:ABC transporter substrate-binding protein n=1 Tax=Micromonospora sp. KC606 TaxID=2530379 RepID=UPI0010473AF8|nr:ABC transporter substrate-binding protein [Micromonospora sp. KC606]TDC82702.1 amino acid ABC transporter substrate-binding protein [Micromonospora sp. KC606]